ncbi:hypothetical protein FHT40_005119 [Mycolicibacterium sp. BK556]|uniref:hypothetical protein n=1 Tax=Mycobacteriaceae TaxID=1762 RepID=UPI0010620D37|nr:MULTISPECIES: hypothetical protein [Mycobacteriaceae]MBB3605432.1 hypothetical protein [Mycolicibacterium sp. BK556]MBB3636071.1 hypothetical protein [Mycolicibacterium sp. BK607]MBB3753483.1 hypothetical protein [Mycolicibacterium sp. BK634]TDO08757.1 hypothetical protein EV580_4786 [Mycobacterium sp. BK086]
MDDSDDQGFQPRAYPPSILIGGAGLVVVLAGLVVSVLMVSAASVTAPRLSPAVRVPPAATMTATPTAVAGDPTPRNYLDAFVAHLTPQLPAFDRVLQAP